MFDAERWTQATVDYVKAVGWLWLVWVGILVTILADVFGVEWPGMTYPVALAFALLTPLVAYKRLDERKTMEVEKERDKNAELRQMVKREKRKAFPSHPIVSVKPFHPGADFVSIYVTNETKQHDQFTAQLIGWDRGEVRPLVGYTAYTIEWHPDDSRDVGLGTQTTGRIDFARITHRDVAHSVSIDEEVSERHVSTLSIKGLDLPAPPDRADAFLHAAWESMKDFKPRVYTFLIRFTNTRSTSFQDVCVTVRVVGSDHDDPHLDPKWVHNLAAPTHFSRPQLRISIADPASLKTPDAKP